jgi:hypothetical protein
VSDRIAGFCLNLIYIVDTIKLIRWKSAYHDHE